MVPNFLASQKGRRIHITNKKTDSPTCKKNAHRWEFQVNSIHFMISNFQAKTKKYILMKIIQIFFSISLQVWEKTCNLNDAFFLDSGFKFIRTHVQVYVRNLRKEFNFDAKVAKTSFPTWINTFFLSSSFFINALVQRQKRAGKESRVLFFFFAADTQRMMRLIANTSCTLVSAGASKGSNFFFPPNPGRQINIQIDN